MDKEDDMVARVARVQWDWFANANQASFDEDTYDDRGEYLKATRAVIAAMREPTGAMIDAGVEAVLRSEYGQILGAWRAMIDAALGVKP